MGLFVLRSFVALNRQIAAAAPLTIQPNSNPLAPRRLTAHGLGYGFPAVLVASCALTDLFFVKGSMNYGRAPFCWIHRQYSVSTTFIIPTGVMLSLNVIVFVSCVVLLLKFRYDNGGSLSAFKRRKSFAFVFSKLLIGLGFQWLFGVASHYYPNEVALRLIFVVVSSLHGFAIFAFTLGLQAVRRRIYAASSFVFNYTRDRLPLRSVNSVGSLPGNVVGVQLNQLNRP